MDLFGTAHVEAAVRDAQTAEDLLKSVASEDWPSAELESAADDALEAAARLRRRLSTHLATLKSAK